MDEDDSSPTCVRGFKHRLNQVFSRDAVRRIDGAIQYVHDVMCATSLLVKYRVTKLALTSSDYSIPPLVVNEKEVWNAIRSVQTNGDPNGSTTRVNKKRGRSDGSSEPGTSRQPADGKASREALLNEWMADYRELTSRCPSAAPTKDRGKAFSVSHILGLAAKQYAAAVLSNVRYHYRSYVCCALGFVLRCKATAVENGLIDGTPQARVKTFDDLSSSTKKTWRQEFGKAYDDVLYHRFGDDMKCAAVLRPVVERHRDRLVPPLPPRTRSIDSDLDGSKRPYVYLGYMIRLASFIERAGNVTGRRRTLLSPIPMKTSYIPAHYGIDTTGITHLLLDDVRGFKRYFEEDLRFKGGFPLPGLRTKADICGSLVALTTGTGRQVTSRDEELFKDALWTFIGRFRNRKTKRLNPLTGEYTTPQGSMRFAHSISTDGYSVTLVCSNEAVRGRNHAYKSGASSRKRKMPGDDNEVPEAFRREFPLLTLHTVPDILKYLKDIGCEDYKAFVGGDPGKGVLLALVDELKKKLRYTGAQRRHETDGRSHKRIIEARTGRPGKKTLREPVSSATLRHGATSRRYPADVRILRSRKDTPGDRETPRLIYVTADGLQRKMSKMRLTPKTTDLRRLQEYMAFREATREVFEATYRRPLFRVMRFTAWTMRRKSVEAFAERIVATYGNRSPNQQVVILYGDWGRRPNLRHQAPSPGIGLRRVLHGYQGQNGRRIVTLTVRETFTSSYDPETLRSVSEARDVHALLREDVHPNIPQNKRGCFWSRDVLGALNILRKGTHLLQHQTEHPRFKG